MKLPHRSGHALNMNRNPSRTLVLTRSDVATVLDRDTCIDAVEHALRLHGDGRAASAMLGVRAANGGVFTKAAINELSRPFFAAKTVGNFPHNAGRFGPPAVVR